MGDTTADENNFYQNYIVEKEQMQREINKLKDEIKKLKLLQKREMETKLDELKEEIQNEFKDQILQLRILISQEQLTSTFNKNFEMEVFNKLDGETQKNIIDDMISKDNTNQSINKIGELLYYLSNEFQRSNIKDKKENFVYFPEQAFTNRSEINKIGVSSQMSEILFNNGQIDSYDLQEIINKFSIFEIQLKYPSNNFDDIFNSVSHLKASMANGKIFISIIVSGVHTTDKKFRNNSIIDSVTLDSSVTTIAGGSFCGSFQGCSSLKHCSLPPSLLTIGGYVFSECTSLGEIIIPPNVTKIGNFAFSDCKSLRTIIIPDSVVEIGNCAFNGCSSVTKIFIPRSVAKIGKSAFLNCNSLKELYIPASSDTNEMLSIQSNVKVFRI